MKRIDWPAVKSAYVNGNETFAQVAARHNLNANSLRQRAAREHWTAARAARADSLLEKVTERSVIDAAQELASYNAGDLLIAKELRDLVMQRLQKVRNLSPCDIRQLAGAIESVQRVARCPYTLRSHLDSIAWSGEHDAESGNRAFIRHKMFPTLCPAVAWLVQLKVVRNGPEGTDKTDKSALHVELPGSGDRPRGWPAISSHPA